MLFHFSAGYNNVEVAEYLLEHGADVNARDKGGLIPLHNASSYGVSWNNIHEWQLLKKKIIFFLFEGNIAHTETITWY